MPTVTDRQVDERLAWLCLLPWDRSAVSRRAFDLAIDLSRRYESDPIALSVAYSPAHAETSADGAESSDAARRYFQNIFDAVRDRAERVGLPVQHDIIDGHELARALLDHAHEHGFDLIVGERETWAHAHP